MGAAGRDFHNFNVCFDKNPLYKVVAFTASQIPDIDGRKYKGIPIYPEDKIVDLIKKKKVSEVFFSYSDISYVDLMEKSAIVMAAGASFTFLGKNQTMLDSAKPVIAVTAVRTGCGKSVVSQKIADFFSQKGLNVGIVRHPMPYGDLKKQVCQKFTCVEDLDKYNCTIEEREEYEPYLEKGLTVCAGTDYKKILNVLEKDSDLILWDGGNNDFPFFRPDLYIVLADAYRPGHELSYFPGEINFRSADVIVISKITSDSQKNVKIILENAKKANPLAKIVEAKSALVIDRSDLVKNKTVLVVEDGPSMTHGGLSRGAGFNAARKFGAKKIIDPRAYLKGSLKKVFEKYPHMENILPAMGYGKKQIKELENIINSAKCDSVVLATPARLEKFLKINKPIASVRYTFNDIGKEKLTNILNNFFGRYFKR